MKNNDRYKLDPAREDRALETADAVARAAHLWVRSVCLNESQREDERNALAGGLVAGLCEYLTFDSRIRELVAYVYTLLDNGGDQSVALSRLMLEEPLKGRQREAYERGKSEATGIVEMLKLYDRR